MTTPPSDPADKPGPERLAALSNLKAGWNGYNAPPPNEVAIANAAAFLDVMLAMGCEPTQIGPSAVGGVAISKRQGDLTAYVEFANAGSRLTLFSCDRDPEPLVTRFGADQRAMVGMVSEIQGFFL